MNFTLLSGDGTAWMTYLTAKDLVWQLLSCFVEFFYRGGRDLPELDIALGAVVGSIVSDGQLAGIDSANVGDLSTCPVLCVDDGCDVRTSASQLFGFGQVQVIDVGQ